MIIIKRQIQPLDATQKNTLLFFI